MSGAGALPVCASKQAFSMTKGNLKDNYWILFQTNETGNLAGRTFEQRCFQSENSLRAASSKPVHVIASIVPVIL